ncbi:unnamed protein product [Mytilus coruscus]|uniref:B box-type domain-containing protein n=1 Tax=Mytilus coruscus TaxID=42192 RepID=A0A6J8E554_MYTCO|nr:unnamed protein product [Mytilus coruscus]
MAQNAMEICEICTQAPGSWVCVECEQIFCHNCKSMHLRMKQSRNHTFNERGHQHNIQNVCDSHHLEYIYFCENCNTLACNTCIVKNHKGHEMATISDASLDKKREISDILAFYKENIRNQHKVGDTVKEKLASLKSECDRIADGIINRCSMLHSKIDKVRDSMINEIGNMFNKEQTKGNMYIDKIKSMDDAMKDVCQKFDQIVEEKNSVALLMFSQTFQNDHVAIGHNIPEKPNISRIKYDEETTDESWIHLTIQNLFGTLEITNETLAESKPGDCKQQ